MQCDCNISLGVYGGAASTKSVCFLFRFRERFKLGSVVEQMHPPSATFFKIFFLVLKSQDYLLFLPHSNPSCKTRIAPFAVNVGFEAIIQCWMTLINHCNPAGQSKPKRNCRFFPLILSNLLLCSLFSFHILLSFQSSTNSLKAKQLNRIV